MQPDLALPARTEGLSGANHPHRGRRVPARQRKRLALREILQGQLQAARVLAFAIHRQLMVP